MLYAAGHAFLSMRQTERFALLPRHGSKPSEADAVHGTGRLPVRTAEPGSVLTGLYRAGRRFDSGCTAFMLLKEQTGFFRMFLYLEFNKRLALSPIRAECPGGWKCRRHPVQLREADAAGNMQSPD